MCLIISNHLQPWNFDTSFANIMWGSKCIIRPTNQRPAIVLTSLSLGRCLDLATLMTFTFFLSHWLEAKIASKLHFRICLHMACA